MLLRTLHSRFRTQDETKLANGAWSLLPIGYSYANADRMMQDRISNKTIRKRPGDGLSGR